MKLKFLILLSLTYTFTALSQQYVLQGSIGNFRNASSFYVTSAGFIYVTDVSSDEIIKIDTLGNKLKDAGGYGWAESTFDYPSDVFATPLNVYVSDKNNHRIERFDKNLNYISQLFTRNNENPSERFGYPISCATSNQGDLYILDSENKRIIKFNLFGQFEQNFGGFDAGAFALQDPKKLSVSPSNNIYVLDEFRIVIFDQFGNGIRIINLEENFSDINIVANHLTANNKQHIYIANLKNSQPELVKATLIGEINDIIVSSLIFGNKLYILLKNEILVFQMV
ncbi:MAG TPA: NHL repeat-containing protein [Ignavibacteriaceae bacterium]|nr:NHL repeat-containing protein [Ignavibacteriaceae bacterium]